MRLETMTKKVEFGQCVK